MGMLEDDLTQAAALGQQMRETILRDGMKNVAREIGRDEFDQAMANIAKTDSDTAAKSQNERLEEVKGPIVIWRDYGREGWQPQSYQTLVAAVEAGALSGVFKATLAIDLKDCINDPF